MIAGSSKRFLSEIYFAGYDATRRLCPIEHPRIIRRSRTLHMPQMTGRNSILVMNRCLKLWSNGTPNSSQVTKSKFASAGGQTVLPSRASSHENHWIFWLPPRSHQTIIKQLGESWPRWPNGTKRGSSWTKIWTWSNSSQLEPSRWPNDTQLHPSQKLGSSWFELGGPFGQAWKKRVLES